MATLAPDEKDNKYRITAESKEGDLYHHTIPATSKRDAAAKTIEHLKTLNNKTFVIIKVESPTDTTIGNTFTSTTDGFDYKNILLQTS